MNLRPATTPIALLLSDLKRWAAPPEHPISMLAWLMAAFFLLLIAVAENARGDELPLPPPPAPLEGVLPQAAAGQAEIIDEAEQLWPAPQAEASAADSLPAVAPAYNGLPPGIIENPNLGARHPMPNPTNTVVALNDLNPVLSQLGAESPRAGLEAELFTQLRAALPSGANGYLFEKATLPAQLRLPRSPYTIRYDFRLPTRGVGAVPFAGNVLDANGQVFSRFTGSAWLDREARGLQVTRVIARGETIREGDVQPLGTRLSQLPRGALDPSTSPVGANAKSELRPGVWLTDQHLSVAQVVKRSQAVTIRLKRGPLELAAPGVAMQDGALGQVIKVENAQSKREIFARVCGPDEVQVIY